MKLIDLKPSGSKAMFAIRATAGGLFLAPDTTGALVPLLRQPDATCLFDLTILTPNIFALRHLATNKYVTTINGAGDPETAILKPDRPAQWGPDAWEKFTLQGDGIKSLCNSRLWSTTSSQIKAKALFQSPSEAFRIMPVIDAAEVMTAFADKHPGHCKQRSYHHDDSGLGWVNTGKVFESRIAGATSQVACTFMSPNWPDMTGYAYCITDWYYLSPTRIGIAGDYERKHIDGKVQSNDRTFGSVGGNLAFTQDNVLALLPRYITPDMTGLSVVSRWQDCLGQNASPTGTMGICHNIIDFIGMKQGRWMLRVTSDPCYPKENGHDNGFPYEGTYYDLGPAENVYDPQLGYVGYRHDYVTMGTGEPSGNYAEEFYDDVVAGEFHQVITPFLTV